MLDYLPVPHAQDGRPVDPNAPGPVAIEAGGGGSAAGIVINLGQGTFTLASNKLGYEVGVRVNIDVLNAQQQLYSTRRELAAARYNTILSQLRLKAVVGTLGEEDVEDVNRALGQ